jgi:mannose-6-phosphate isomerase-like protein (cupin superfamily)
MRRLNFLADEPWDQVDDEDGWRVRWFGHPFAADMLGASLIELRPGSPDGPLHMHYGVEEMFFVLPGRPTVRTPEGEEQLSPGDIVYHRPLPRRRLNRRPRSAAELRARTDRDVRRRTRT